MNESYLFFCHLLVCAFVLVGGATMVVGPAAINVYHAGVFFMVAGAALFMFAVLSFRSFECGLNLGFHMGREP